ncbi:MAG: hypothetical protein R3332_08445 [Pseudohongiellaceae bacterium]|nr:hypothetical protein [Pseudohongiellaceae bacterium]
MTQKSPQYETTFSSLAQQSNGQWYPGADAVFVIINMGNPQDPLCALLFVCVDASMPNHVVGKPVIADGYTARPVLLSKQKYTFSEGTDAMHALGLKDEVVQAIKQVHNAQAKLDD